MFLAGDVGGSKTVLSLYPAGGDPRVPIESRTFSNAGFASLQKILHAFLAGRTVEAALLAVAGPIRQGRAQLTNRSWQFDAARLSAEFGIPHVVLENDLYAIAAAIPQLRDDELVTLQAGRSDATGNLAVIAPGTGLGEAFLLRNERGGFLPSPSEGGHSAFAAQNGLEWRLQCDLQTRYGTVSYERICSGPGIAALYDFLCREGDAADPPMFRAAVAAAAEPAALISRAAIEAPALHPAAARTMQLFVEILGREAGNLALTVFSGGGLYLAGGIPPKILPLLQTGAFIEAFLRKGRMRSLLETIPLRVVTTQATILGAACLLLDEKRSSAPHD